MNKEILFSEDARKKMADGIEKVAKAVGSTLGPRGKFGIVETPFGVPVITKDGVSLAKEISLEDKFENLGCELVKDIASKSNEVGDGTTTATVMGNALTKEGLKVMASGVSSVDLKRGIDVATEDIINEIFKSSKPVERIEDIYNVAKISSNNDETIAKLVSDAFEKVGNDGLITVNESDNGETYLSFKEGMNIDRGYIVPYFINNDKMTCEFKNAYVLVTDETITSTKQIIKILNDVANSGKSLLIIADDVSGEALNTLIVNNAKGSISVNVVKAPSFGDNKSNILEDIAILTGAEFISEKFGLKLNDCTLDWLGEVDKVISTKTDTLFVGGHGDKNEIDERIKSIRSAMEVEKNETLKDKFKERMAKLSGGVCVLNVYSHTDVSMKELRDRVEDTLCSVRASIKSGIVLGGGVTLLRIGRNIKPSVELTEEEMIGYNIVKNALEYPIRTLARNSNLSEDLIVEETLKNSNGKSGYNMLTRKWDDNLIDKVVDPTLVEVTAIKNASSIVSLMLNCEVAIVEKINKESDCKCK